jgi:hypothetical protein
MRKQIREASRGWCVLAASFLIALAAVGASGAAARAATAHSEGAPAVDYTIHVRLDPVPMRLHGSETLRYTNRSPDAIPDLRFHLYLNGFRNEESTFMRESRGHLRRDEMPTGGWGWIDVQRLTIAGADRTQDVTYIQPDGTDPDDRTVARVPLASPLRPGETIEVAFDFEAQLPKVFARTGYRGDYVLAGQWFPKIGVWESVGQRHVRTPGWNCHQFHATTEFYADFGRYQVHITVPAGFVVGATGAETGRVQEDDTTTYSFEQDRVIDFAWTASPRFLREERIFRMQDWVSDEELGTIAELHGITPDQARLPDTTMILLLQPEHRAQADRHFRALANAIKYFGLWYGPYPYPTITLVDPAWKAGGSGGMEYPNFITAGTQWLTPDDDRGGIPGTSGPEGVTIHEFGHQYWQSMVATNEFEEPWLDEGINSYSTARVMDAAYGSSGQYFRLNQVPLPVYRWLGLAPLDQRQYARLGPITDRGQDRIWRKAWEFRSIFSYFVNSYPKSVSVLWQLQEELGEDVMARLMRTYFQRWQFRHPDTRDFVDVAEEVSGRDLDWFFDQLLFGTGTLDYAVTEAESERLGFEAGVFDTPEGRITLQKEEMESQREEAEEKEDDTGPYRTTVVIENHGTIEYPVDILVRFTDGSEVRERWDGAYRWVRFSYQRDAALDRVVVDPEERLVIDLNRANNSFVAEPTWRAELRWGLKLLLLIQNLLQTLGSAVT